MGLPPVFVGGYHAMVQLLGVYPSTSGWLGGSGGSNGHLAVTGLPSRGSETPYIVSARTLKIYFLPSVSPLAVK